MPPWNTQPICPPQCAYCEVGTELCYTVQKRSEADRFQAFTRRTSGHCLRSFRVANFSDSLSLSLRYHNCSTPFSNSSSHISLLFSISLLFFTSTKISEESWKFLILYSSWIIRSLKKCLMEKGGLVEWRKTTKITPGSGVYCGILLGAFVR